MRRIGFHNGIAYDTDDDNLITANLLDYDEKVGAIEIEDKWLKHIDVSKKYRRKGIATKLIKYAIKFLDLRKIPCVTESQKYLYSLSSEGEKLIAYCIKQNIVKVEMCQFAGNRDLLEEGEEDDPHYNSITILRALNRREQRPKYIETLITDYYSPSSGEDISAKEMSECAFGKASNTAKKLR